MTEGNQKPRNAEENVVFIGTKPFMNYVTSVVMQFTTKGAEKVVVKARGKFISRCVDVVEVATKRFLKDSMDTSIDDIKIGSEQFTNKEGRNVRVSFMEITLGKK